MAENKPKTIKMEIFIVIKDNTRLFYLLKVERRNFDVYCYPPHLGIHYSLHESAESHFRHEETVAESTNQLPIAFIMGEAGTVDGNNIISTSLVNLGRAICICTAIYPITSLASDFQEFNRSTKNSFIIDSQVFPKNTKLIEVGVWAVPDRNKISFEFNNPSLSAKLLHKVTQFEPQIWAYAKSV